MDLNIILYGVASIFYLIVGGKIVSTFKKRGDQAPTWSLPVIAAAIVAHFWVLQSSIFCAPQTIWVTFGNSISAICFFSTLILFFGALYSRVHALYGIVLLIAGLGIWSPFLFPSDAQPIVGSTMGFKLHIAFGLLAYSFMLMSVVQAVLMSILNSRLKNHEALEEPEGIVASMPNLMTMERILFRVIFACFVVLTLTIITGMVSTVHYLDALLAFDHKTVLTILSWLVFGILLLGRKLLGWRSRKALTIFWIAVALQVIAFLAYRFVLDVLK